MATLHVENVPDELYAALRRRARSHRKSIAAEVLSLIEENVPTEQNLQVRRKLWRRAKHLRDQAPLSALLFPRNADVLC